MTKTCKLSFPYARDWGYGREMRDENGRVVRNYDPHFVQVASSFAVGRQYKQFNPRAGWETAEPAFTSDFVFTGYETVKGSKPDNFCVFDVQF